jgi:hypothetical protein
MDVWVGMLAVVALSAAGTIWLQQSLRVGTRLSRPLSWRFGAVAPASTTVLEHHERRRLDLRPLPHHVRIRRAMTIASNRFPADTLFWINRHGEVYAFVAPADVEIEGRPVRGGERAEITLDGRFGAYTAAAPHRYAVIGGADLWCDAGDVVDATLDRASPIRRAIEFDTVTLAAGTHVWLDPDSTGIGAQLAEPHQIHGVALSAGTTLRILARTWIGRALWREGPDVIATFPDEGDYRTAADRRILLIRRDGTVTH